jgi:hypothetical protein
VEKDLPSYLPPKEVEAAILISDKVDFNHKIEGTKKVTSH